MSLEKSPNRSGQPSTFPCDRFLHVSSGYPNVAKDDGAVDRIRAEIPGAGAGWGHGGAEVGGVGGVDGGGVRRRMGASRQEPTIASASARFSEHGGSYSAVQLYVRISPLWEVRGKQRMFNMAIFLSGAELARETRSILAEAGSR